MNMDKMLYNHKAKEKGKQINARLAMSIWNHSRHAKKTAASLVLQWEQLRRREGIKC